MKELEALLNHELERYKDRIEGCQRAIDRSNDDLERLNNDIKHYATMQWQLESILKYLKGCK
jgi:archaellum component FlaC